MMSILSVIFVGGIAVAILSDAIREKDGFGLVQGWALGFIVGCLVIAGMIIIF